MSDEMLNVRMELHEKQALRILAANNNMNVSTYVLKVLRDNTALKSIADSLAKRSSDENQNDTHEMEHAAR